MRSRSASRCWPLSGIAEATASILEVRPSGVIARCFSRSYIGLYISETDGSMKKPKTFKALDSAKAGSNAHAKATD